MNPAKGMGGVYYYMLSGYYFLPSPAQFPSGQGK